MPDTEFIKNLTDITLPKIKTHKVVYLPMLDDILTIENLGNFFQFLLKLTLEKTSSDFQKYLQEKANKSESSFKVEESKHGSVLDESHGSIPKTKSKPKQFSSKMIKKHYIEDLNNDKNPLYLTKDVLYRPERHVMVRILSPVEFPVDWKNRMIKREVIQEYNNKGVKRSSMFSNIFSKKNTKVLPSRQHEDEVNVQGFC